MSTSGWQIPGLERLWAETRGEEEICVAVVDGPIDLTHPCFEGARLEQLDTLVPHPGEAGPAARHGTHVASLIFGQPGSPVPGLAPGCRGLLVPVFHSAGEETRPCSQLDLARALGQALQGGAQVINVSGGQIEPSGAAHPLLADAVRRCTEAGVLLVAAAGNDGCDCLHIPAAIPSALAVGAMDGQGAPLPFSNWGDAYRRQGLLAPGQELLGALPGGGTARQTGTSFATAVVSGIAALLLSLQVRRGGKPDPWAVRAALLAGAIDCEEQPVPDCRRLLAGRLSLERTLGELAQGGTIVMSEPILRNPVEMPEGAPLLGPAGGPLAGPEGEVRPSCSCTDRAAAPPEPASPSAAEAASRIAAPGNGKRSLAYALGQTGYDFVSEARRDSLVQAGLAQPYDPGQLLAFLDAHPTYATAVTWTLHQETIPIYAVRGAGPFGAEVYETLREFLREQLRGSVQQVSVPGEISGSTQLLNGQTVPTLWAEVRGMYSWSTAALVEAVAGKADDQPERDRNAGIANFLDRVYYELRNLGLAPQERAINFAATNAFQLGTIFGAAIDAGMRLDGIAVERSPICRPESDCWDVKLTFFDPSRRLEQAREVHRFTVDVSDVVPVTIGGTRHWFVY